MKLYYSAGACSLASHILLLEVGKEFELVRVNLKTHLLDNGEPFETVNPKGFVPALQLIEGDVLTENTAVLPYIASLDSTGRLLPKDEYHRAKMSEALGFLSSELHPAFSPFFKHGLNDEQKQQGYQLIDQLLNILEMQLQRQHSTFLVADQFGPADAYLFAVTNWSRGIGHHLDAFPAILKLRKATLARPMTQLAMQREGLIR